MGLYQLIVLHYSSPPRETRKVSFQGRTMKRTTIWPMGKCTLLAGMFQMASEPYFLTALTVGNAIPGISHINNQLIRYTKPLAIGQSGRDIFSCEVPHARISLNVSNSHKINLQRDHERGNNICQERG